MERTRLRLWQIEKDHRCHAIFWSDRSAFTFAVISFNWANSLRRFSSYKRNSSNVVSGLSSLSSSFWEFRSWIWMVLYNSETDGIAKQWLLVKRVNWNGTGMESILLVWKGMMITWLSNPLNIEWIDLDSNDKEKATRHLTLFLRPLFSQNAGEYHSMGWSEWRCIVSQADWSIRYWVDSDQGIVFRATL